MLSWQATSTLPRSAMVQELPQPLAGAGQARHDGSHRQTTDLRDLLVTEALQLAQDQRLPELDGKAFKRFQKSLPRGALEQLNLGALPPVLDVVNLRIERDGGSLRPGSLEPVVSRVAHDGQEPGLSVPAAESPEESNGTEIGLLDHVLRILAAAAQPARRVVRGALLGRD